MIGKQAPDFTVQIQDGKDISLYGIHSPFTVLFFWAPNCSHCKESIPILKGFNESYKGKGVQVFAVCTKLNGQEKNCWEYLEENNLDSWINASNQSGGQSSIHTTYNIQSTPKIYVLDADKTILAKDLGVEHLEEVMTRLQLYAQAHRPLRNSRLYRVNALFVDLGVDHHLLSAKAIR